MDCRKTIRTCVLLAMVSPGVIVVAGCGSDHPGLVPVSGTVTVQGGPPPAAGTVWFNPLEPAEGFPHKPATGDFDAEGHYRAKSFQPGDGLFPGRYAVSIHCWEVPPNMEGKPVKSYIAAKYQGGTTSGLELTVPPDASAEEFNIDVE